MYSRLALVGPDLLSFCGGKMTEGAPTTARAAHAILPGVPATAAVPRVTTGRYRALLALRKFIAIMSGYHGEARKKLDQHVAVRSPIFSKRLPPHWRAFRRGQTFPGFGSQQLHLIPVRPRTKRLAPQFHHSEFKFPRILAPLAWKVLTNSYLTEPESA